MINADDQFMIQCFINNGQTREAADLICKLRFGMTADEVEQNLREEMTAVIKQTGQLFQERHPEFYPCKENEQIMFQWMLNRNLDGMRIESFELAYQNVKDILVGRPEADKPEPPPKPKKEWEKYSEQEIERMSPQEYKEKILLPQFRETPKPTRKRMTAEERDFERLSAAEYKEKYVLPELKAARQSR